MQFATLLKLALVFAAGANALPAGPKCNIHRRDVQQMTEVGSVGEGETAELEKRRAEDLPFECSGCGKKWKTKSEADSCSAYHKTYPAWTARD